MNSVRRSVQRHVSKPTIGILIGSSLVAFAIVAHSFNQITSMAIADVTLLDMPNVRHSETALARAAFASLNIHIPDKTLRGGDESLDVVDLQKFLRAKGFIASTTPLNGHFGPTTEHALRRYQASKHLEETGTLGPKTREVVKKEVGR